jgi:3'-phosphoadenosine 5'-phosphosulfate sulfotransferase (PAPS reductase)/FAD synthetase
MTEMIKRAVQRVREGARHFNPIAIVTLFSGGHDSATATLIGREAGADAALHINTGIGIEETRDYVRDTCASWDMVLLEYKAKDNTKRDGTLDPQIYEDLVRQHGFPGPIMHRKMYSRLKERQLERFERDIGATPQRPILYVSGMRSDESVRRMGHMRRDDMPGLHKDGAHRVWCSPIHDFTKSDCSRCMEHCGLKRNEVVDLIHKSGECLCGAYAQPGELSELKMWFPQVAKHIEDLEREVMPKFPWRWEDPGPPQWFSEKKQGQTFMLDYDKLIWEEPLCQGCNLRAKNR